MGWNMRPEFKKMMDRLGQLKAAGYSPFGHVVSSKNADTIIVGEREYVNYSSNNYLGFAVHPKLKEACIAAVNEFGIGTCGSPLINGTTVLHVRLAQRVAEHYGTDAAIICPTGYQAMLAAIAGLTGDKDITIVDNLAHRSLIDGVAMSGSTKRAFAHNNIEDLDQVLANARKKHPIRLVVVDSVYSMDGDIADLPGLSRVCRKHDALLMVDEAHSLGVIGRNGGGILEHFGMPGAADVIASTFSKFAGSVGGFVTGSADMINYLWFAASAHVFSAALLPSTVAAILTAFDLLKEEPQWVERLQRNAHHMRQGLKDLGFDIGDSQTPVVPIIIPDMEKTFLFGMKIFERGILAQPVSYPAVSVARSRIRLGVIALHTPNQIDKSLEIFKDVGKELGVI